MRNLLSPIWQRVPPSTFLEIEKTSSPHHTNMCRPCLFFPRGATTSPQRSDLTKLAVSLSGNPKIHVSICPADSIRTCWNKDSEFPHIPHGADLFYQLSAAFIRHLSEPCCHKSTIKRHSPATQRRHISGESTIFYTSRNIRRNTHKKLKNKNDSAKTSRSAAAFP